jgi:glycosyltransferase involved in cell wall biosynthesis
MQVQEYGDGTLRILHVLRAPLGGLFRHVYDLAREQIRRGHEVGIIADSTTGGKRAETMLAELEPSLKLGIARLPIRRPPHPFDLAAAVQISSMIRARNVDVVHGHGSKGGLFARLPGLFRGSKAPIRAYTPHGGSFNYVANPLFGTLYMTAERVLERATDLFLFESAFIANRFFERVGATEALVRLIPNGISPSEFLPVEAAPDAAEFVYVGELRSAKGIDILIEAMADVASRYGRPSRLVLVGSGPDQANLAALAAARGLADCLSFVGPLPARQAFTLGRILVVPSRAESLPYIVLEAAGAQVPIVATNVGGIGEIFGPYRDRLIPCDDPIVLAENLAAMLETDPLERQRQSVELAAFVASRFTLEGMTDAVIAGYRDAIGRRVSKKERSAFALPLLRD